MEQKDQSSDNGDGEDIPSDFFDDFNKDEFMEGLSVIDSWDDDEGVKRRGSRINAEAIDSVKDLRELIDYKDDDRSRKRERNEEPDDDRNWEKKQSPRRERSSSNNRLDDFIKPGSRRDPSKTNEAIKRDKEEKVKEYLAKHLESGDDLRPPGTELDGFFEAKSERKKTPVEERGPSRQSKEINWELPQRTHHSPQWDLRLSPHHSMHRSPHHSMRRSPRRSPRFSPRRQQQRMQRRSPRRSPQRKFSPQRRMFRREQSPQWRGPRRYSPGRRSPRRNRRSKSPLPFRPRYESRDSRRSRSRSPRDSSMRDNFLYPKSSAPQPEFSSQPTPPYQLTPQYPNPGPGLLGEYAVNVTPGYLYPQDPNYSGFGVPYNYQPQLIPTAVPAPQPVPAPTGTLGSMPTIPMIPTPQIDTPTLPKPSNTTLQLADKKTPYDALAQLVAEGKISKEDYLKLAPNKSKKGGAYQMDTKARVAVLNRCSAAMSKLTKLILPNRLLINNNMIGPEPKCIAPKYCSPLKRQATVEFHFTKSGGSNTTKQNKQLVDSIIATIGLDKVITRPKKKSQKDMKDAACQTTKPYCDVCEIREATKTSDSCTSIDPEHFCSSVHTQVLEHDLISSKSIFNPSGSVGDGGPISIAHLTPAQLVSQLAARAKTLKQTDPGPGQYGRRPNNYDYEYDGRGGGGGQNYQNNYNNYRY